MAPNGVYSVRRLEKSVSFEERLACFLASAQIPPAFSRAGRTDSIDCATPTHLAELNHLEASRRARSPSHLLLELRARHILGLEVGLRSPHPFHAASAPHSVSSSLIAKCSSTAFFSSSSMSCSSSLVFHSFSSSLAQLHFRADVLGQVVAHVSHHFSQNIFTAFSMNFRSCSVNSRSCPAVSRSQRIAQASFRNHLGRFLPTRAFLPRTAPSSVPAASCSSRLPFCSSSNASFSCACACASLLSSQVKWCCRPLSNEGSSSHFS